MQRFPFVFIGRLAATYTRAAATMIKAYAAGSQKSYFNKFHVLLLFCAYYQIELQSLNVNNVICFVQLLVDSRLSTPTIHTYLSAIKSKLSSFGFDNSIWSHHRVILILFTGFPFIHKAPYSRLCSCWLFMVSSAYQIYFPLPERLFSPTVTLSEVTFPLYTPVLQFT